MSTEVIHYTLTSTRLPDAETTVLACIDHGDGDREVFPAYVDCGSWYDVTGMPVFSDVVSWADMPAGFFPS